MAVRAAAKGFADGGIEIGRNGWLRFEPTAIFIQVTESDFLKAKSINAIDIGCRLVSFPAWLVFMKDAPVIAVDTKRVAVDAICVGQNIEWSTFAVVEVPAGHLGKK